MRRTIACEQLLIACAECLSYPGSIVFHRRDGEYNRALHRRSYGALPDFVDSLIDLRDFPLKERRAKLHDEELVENGNRIEELLGKTASLPDVASEV